MWWPEITLVLDQVTSHVLQEIYSKSFLSAEISWVLDFEHIRESLKKSIFQM